MYKAQHSWKAALLFNYFLLLFISSFNWRIFNQVEIKITYPSACAPCDRIAQRTYWFVSLCKRWNIHVSRPYLWIDSKYTTNEKIFNLSIGYWDNKFCHSMISYMDWSVFLYFQIVDLIRTISKSNRRLLIMTIRPNGEERFCLFSVSLYSQFCCTFRWNQFRFHRGWQKRD